MVNTQVVANTFLYRAFKENISVTPMKLQKLIYFLYREYAQESGEQLFSEQFETWKYGPVLPSVYYEFQGYDENTIDRFARDAQGDVQILNLDHNSELKSCFNKIWNRYKHHSGPDLSNITHRSGTAWYKAKQQGNPTLKFEDIINDKEY